jgi:ethanolamine utilization protein EutQ (cupin superfamily)
MSDNTKRKPAAPFEFYSGHIPPGKPGSSDLVEHTNGKTGATLSTGLVTFMDCETAPWQLWYDEVLAVHSMDGEFSIDFDGVPYPMKVGDFVWIRAGSKIVYRSKGRTTLFYACTPADWAERGKPA